MYTTLLAVAASLSSLATAQEAPITTPTTLEKRYTPPPGESASCPYICKDYFDDCGNTYGPGCFSSCPGYPEPTFATPVCNEVVATTAAPVMAKRYTPPPGESASCLYICKDYFDDCGNTYGPGCFSSCPGYPEPTYTTPVCNEAVATTTAPVMAKRYSPPAGQSADCPYICKDYFDDCGNTYGPGCFSSCPGYPEPTYTTPVCNEAKVRAA